MHEQPLIQEINEQPVFNQEVMPKQEIKQQPKPKTSLFANRKKYF